MKPAWLIQTNMDGVDTRPMIAEVRRQGMRAIETEHSLVRKIDFLRIAGVHGDTDGSFLDLKNPHLRVVCYGDIDFVRQIQRTVFVPGAYCNFDNMKCSTYYAYLGGHLLNKDYLMLPVGDLLRRWDGLIVSNFNRPLFIRPSSGAKPFTGYVVEPEGRDKIQTLIETVGPDTLVVVAPEKEITIEWRFVICDGKVVTGCQYLPIEQEGWSTPSLCLASKIAAQEWQPDRCYTVDIAESEGEVYLLEINSFGCAGFYKCDVKQIVRCASEAAVNEWKEYC